MLWNWSRQETRYTEGDPPRSFLPSAGCTSLHFTGKANKRANGFPGPLCVPLSVVSAYQAKLPGVLLDTRKAGRRQASTARLYRSAARGPLPCLCNRPQEVGRATLSKASLIRRVSRSRPTLPLGAVNLLSRKLLHGPVQDMIVLLRLTLLRCCTRVT